MGTRATSQFADVFDKRFLAALERLHLIGKSLSVHGPAGARRSRRLGDGLEFADHRAYAPGDDIRFIDWPYYARMEKFLLRLFHEHSEAGVAILLDASASMAPGGRMEKFNYARRAVAALAYVAMGSLERVELVSFASAPGETMRTGRDRRRIFAVCEFLAAIQPAGRTELARCVSEFFGEKALPGTVILISDLLDSADELSEALGLLRLRRCDVTVLHVYAPSDARPQVAGAATLRHAETDHRIALNVTPQIIESYRRQWETFQAACRRACLIRSARYVAVPTDLPFERLVLAALRRAGVLAG